MAEATGNPKPELVVTDELKNFLKRATKGDRTVEPELRKVLEAHPEIWQRYGDLGLHAERALTALAAGDNHVLHLSLNRKADALRAELSGPSPSPLERILVDRVIACWLQTAYCDAAYAQARPGTLAQDNYLQRRQDRASRRLDQAIKTLATVRKLLPQAKQVGSATNQKPATTAQHKSNGAGRNGESVRATKTPMPDSRDGLQPSGDGASATIAELEIPKPLLDRMRSLVEIAD